MSVCACKFRHAQKFLCNTSNFEFQSTFPEILTGYCATLYNIVQKSWTTPHFFVVCFKVSEFLVIFKSDFSENLSEFLFAHWLLFHSFLFNFSHLTIFRRRDSYLCAANSHFKPKKAHITFSQPAIFLSVYYIHLHRCMWKLMYHPLYYPTYNTSKIQRYNEPPLSCVELKWAPGGLTLCCLDKRFPLTDEKEMKVGGEEKKTERKSKSSSEAKLRKSKGEKEK